MSDQNNERCCHVCEAIKKGCPYCGRKNSPEPKEVLMEDHYNNSHFSSEKEETLAEFEERMERLFGKLRAHLAELKRLEEGGRA